MRGETLKDLMSSTTDSTTDSTTARSRSRLSHAVACYFILFATTFATIKALAFASNHAVTPSITRHPNKCGLVTVHNLRSGQTTSGEMRQRGVGWVTLAPGKLYVLTPHHVVAHAEQILVQCKEQLYPMKVKAYSPTKDFALLSFERDSSINGVLDLTPMLWIQTRDIYQNALNTLTAEQRQFAEIFNPDISSKTIAQLLEGTRLTGFMFPPPGEENNPLAVSSPDTALGSRAYLRPQRNDEGILPSLLYPLILEGLAVRPGFSGSPAYVQGGSILDAAFAAQTSLSARLQLTVAEQTVRHLSRPMITMGMITKTEINGNRAAVASIDDVIQTAYLLSLTDGNIDRVISAQVIYSSEVHRSDEGLFRLTTGMIKSHQNRWVRFTETCETSFKPSSDWTESSSNHRWRDAYFALMTQHEAPQVGTRFGLNLRDQSHLSPVLPQSERRPRTQPDMRNLFARRGDYGDGGAGPDSELFFLIDGGREQYTGGSGSYFKTMNPCIARGLKLEDGRVVTGVRVNDQVHRLTYLSDLEVFVRRAGIQAWNQINTHGVFANSPEAAASICSRPELRGGSSLNFAHANQAHELIQNGEIRYHNIQTVGLATDQSPSGNSLRCSSDRSTLLLSYSDQATLGEADWLSGVVGQTILPTPQAGGGSFRIDATHKLTIRLEADSRGRVRGKAVLGNESKHCLINLDQTNVVVENPWRITIRDPKLEVAVQLGSGSLPLKVETTHADRSCLWLGEQNELWLLKSEFSVRPPQARPR